MLVDRYILMEWFKVFCLTIFAIFGLLILGNLQDNLQDLLGFDATWTEILRYYVVLMPSFMPAALPTAFMISLLFSLGQLHRNHEITALRTAGMSLLRITRSLWLVGVALMVLLFQLNARLVPWSVEEARLLWDDLEFTKAIDEAVPVEDVGLIYNLTFYNRKDGRLWFLNRFNEYNYRAYGLTVSEIRPEDGQELRRVVANEGFYDDVRKVWTFLSGRETQFDPNGGGPIRSLGFDRRLLEGYSENPELMKYLEQRPKDLSSRELKMVVDYLKPAGDPRLAKYAVSFYDRMINPIGCLIILGLAIPFSLRGVRTNPFVGVSKAMGLFILYYILLNAAQLSGSSGLDPLVSASIPHVAAIVLVGYYFLRLQRP